MKMVALMRGTLLGLVLMTGPAFSQEAPAPADPATPAPKMETIVDAPSAVPLAAATLDVKPVAEMPAVPLRAIPIVVRDKVAGPASTQAPGPVAAENPQNGATITLKPHNVHFDKTLTRHQALILQYIAESSQVNTLVQRTLVLQHRATLIERDLREARYVLSDTRSRKTRAALTEKIAKNEEELASIGDDAQLANIDLQSALQKQQQTLQTLSNVSKMLHDTAMSVIRKIGG